MHLPALIGDLAMILGVAAIVTFIFQKIRQPVVLGYIVAGVIVGPYTPTALTVTDLPNIKIWAELGVIFLMFSLGLEFSFHKLAKVGVTSAGTALVEVFIMVLLGYGAGRFLGWSTLDSIFLGGILSVSSTTIIIKAFDELGLKTRRFAEIVFGILIVEDLVAILLLVALSTVALTHSLFSFELLVAALKLVFIVGSWFLVGYFIFPTFFRYAGKLLNTEALTVLSTGLCLSLVVLATHFHYSAALGAFIMGSILAETSEAHRIETLIEPLKNLFAAIFFVSVGMLVDPRALADNLGPIALITVLTIVGKMFSSSLGALLTGQPLKRSVQIGCSLAQIGEFSFIIATLGSSLRVTSDFLYPVAVTVSVITTFTTPYLIRYSESLAGAIERALPAGIARRFTGYATWAQMPRAHGEARSGALKQIVRFILNGILVSLIFVGMSGFALPELARFIPDPAIGVVLTWTLAMLFAAPFIWGMFFSFRKRREAKSKRPRGTDYGLYEFLGQLATVIWLGALSSAFFPTWTSLLLTLFACGALFFVIGRNLERSYRWFERRFLQNLNRQTAPQVEDVLSVLAPWDLHLIRLPVHPNSKIAGQTLGDAQIRSRFALNVVAVQRGSEIIAAPKAGDFIFPNDELLVLGTDEQIDKFRAEIAAPTAPQHPSLPTADYFLRRVLVDKDSAFAGRSIRDSGIREALRGLVVGLERGAFRTINPEPALVLKPGDSLWVVSGIP